MGVNGLDSLKCPIEGLSVGPEFALASTSADARLITNEGYRIYSFTLSTSPPPRLESRIDIEEVYATLSSFSVGLGRIEPVERESAALILFEAANQEMEVQIYLNF